MWLADIDLERAYVCVSTASIYPTVARVQKLQRYCLYINPLYNFHAAEASQLFSPLWVPEGVRGCVRALVCSWIPYCPVQRRATYVLLQEEPCVLGDAWLLYTCLYTCHALFIYNSLLHR